MLQRLFPKEYVSSIYKINYKRLKLNNINTLIFDIDNTLVPHYTKDAPKEIIEHFRHLKNLGFKICLLSNNNHKRVKLFNETLNLITVPYAIKPFLYGVNRALRVLKSNPKETAIIGDQIFTDILCGNRKGIYTILVKPVVDIDEISVKVKRGMEKLVIKRYKNIRRLNDDK